MMKTVYLAAAGIGALAIAGCSSSSKGSAPAGSAAAGGGAGGATTVSVKDVSGTSGVLVDSSGMTLYVSDQEMSGKKVLCSTDDCTAIWTPLTVGNGQKPSGPADVMGLLATVARPDGKSQVTLNGAPMYTFSFDHGAGDLKGDGQKDTFGGTSFTWHTATANGAAAPAPSTSSSSDSGGGGYGGY